MLDLLRQGVNSCSMTTLLTASKEKRQRVCSVPGWTFDPLLNQRFFTLYNFSSYFPAFRNSQTF